MGNIRTMELCSGACRVAGNGGSVPAAPEPLHRLPASAALVIPPNSVLVLTSDGGD
jgi:hypothetical protein